MATTTTTLIDQMLRFSPEETRAFFDAQARKLLGISGAEFIRRRDAGELVADDPETRAKLAYLTTLSEAGTCAREDDGDGAHSAGLGAVSDEDQIKFMSPQETWQWFDNESQTLLGISGEEFLRRWDAGEYRDVFDTPGHYGVTHLGMLVDLVR